MLDIGSFINTLRVWRVNFIYQDGTSAYSLTEDGENIFNNPNEQECMLINPFLKRS